MVERGARESRIGAVLKEYAVCWLAGSILGSMFWQACFRGKVRIKGWRNLLRLIRATWHGRLIIVTNHPSLMEVALLPGLGWPMMLIFRRYLFWSMPDRRLFPSRFKWFPKAAHGIEVDRSQPGSFYNVRALHKAKQVLEDGGTIIIHAEGGRTHKWQDPLRQWHSQPATLLKHGNRQIGEINPAVLRLAIKANAYIMPIYIDMPPEAREPRSFTQSCKGLFRGKYYGTTFHFDHPPYRPLTTDKVVEARRLEQKLLNPEGGNITYIHQDISAAS